MLLTVLQLVNQILIVIQFQVVDSVDQTLNVPHSCQRGEPSGFHDNAPPLSGVCNNLSLPRSLLING